MTEPNLPPHVKLDILSDPICPWCYIGKRRFEQAVDELDSADVTAMQVLTRLTRLRQAACAPRLVNPELGVGNAKLEMFGHLLDRLQEGGHRALVFSQFVAHLSLVREWLSKPGEGRVLVVDGGGSTRCALLGDQLGALAVKNGWSGLLIHGCVRDAEELGKLDLGVRALAGCPRKSIKRGEGRIDVAVSFAGITIQPGAFLYADADGILVAEGPIH